MNRTELATRLRAENDALLDYLERLEKRVADLEAQRDAGVVLADELVDIHGLQRLLGSKTLAGASQAVHRSAELKALARKPKGRRRLWSRIEVVKYLEGARAAQNGGGQ